MTVPPQIDELTYADMETCYGNVPMTSYEALMQAKLFHAASRPETLQELAARQNGMLWPGDTYRVCREHYIYHGYDKEFGPFTYRAAGPLPCQWVRDNIKGGR